MRLKIAAIVVLLLVGGAAVAVATGVLTPAATSATTLLTATAEVTDVTDEIAATGTVEAASRYALAFGIQPVESEGSTESDNAASTGSLASSIEWPVTEVTVAVGDQVTKGQVLATAGTADLRAQIGAARRSADSAALQLKQAKADKADASGTVAKRQAQIALNNAESADAKAKSDLAALLALRPLATLTAPADGTVTAVAISAGSDAPDGAAISMISGALQVSTSVVESDIAAIRIDQEATLT